MTERGFHPERILQVLERHGVDYVLIGGAAAVVHGSPHLTQDVDVCPAVERNNLERLAGALVELDARVRAQGVEEPLLFDCSAQFLAKCQVWNLSTIYGELDLSCRPSGTDGYDDLRRSAVVVDLGEVAVMVASLADIVRSKEAANREKDHLTLPTLRAMLERQQRG